MAIPLQRSFLGEIEKWKTRFAAAWSRTDQIFDMIPTGEFSANPIVWRHPFIFYVGHLPAFSWNQICGAILEWQSVNPSFDDLFCRGIDPDVDTGECHWHPEVPESWPALSDTLAYRDKVRGALLQSVEVVARTPAPNVMTRHGRVFQMVLEHEWMHQETLMYMLQQVPLQRKCRPKARPRYAFQSTPECRSIEIPVGRARLGAQFDKALFGWDNEFEQICVDVPSFSIDSLPVTNGQFFEFVDSGGYETQACWAPEDWRWKNIERKSHPTCWEHRRTGWYYRALFDIFPLQTVASWPVYVSLAEARAYAHWIGKRLPSEAEFHRAAYYGPDGRESRYPWGNIAPEPHHGNFDFISLAPIPVGSRPAGASRWGVMELVGNGWELTDTPFAPFPGFSPYIASYPDYSRDFFDGKHFVLKGASWATPSGLIRPTFRNWYQAHYPYVFAKFRCVSD